MGVIITGASNVTVDGLPVARLGDKVQSGPSIGSIIEASGDVTNGPGIARVGDKVQVGSKIGVITTGSSVVTIDGKPCARVTDATSV